MTGICGFDIITGLGRVLNVRVRYEIFLPRKADARRTRFEKVLSPNLMRDGMRDGKPEPQS